MQYVSNLRKIYLEHVEYELFELIAIGYSGNHRVALAIGIMDLFEGQVIPGTIGVLGTWLGTPGTRSYGRRFENSRAAFSRKSMR